LGSGATMASASESVKRTPAGRPSDCAPASWIVLPVPSCTAPSPGVGSAVSSIGTGGTSSGSAPTIQGALSGCSVPSMRLIPSR
jgi:hypothetical protein